MTDLQGFRLGILETGRLPAELAHHGDYPAMVETWLSLPGASVRTYPVLDMTLPDSPDEADLWVVTGSRHGVYEDHPWITPLEGFIREAHARQARMVGLCFGHQIIAQAMGGLVRKSPKGWGIGIHDYAVTDWPDELGESPGRIVVQAYHQDQVETVPATARRVATSEFCENAALWYPGFAITFQGHPEFANDFAADLVRARIGALYDADFAQAALDSMATPTNRHDLAAAIARWVGQGQSQEAAE